MDLTNDDSTSANDAVKAAIPMSAKKKKTYRVVESRYLNYAKSGPHLSPSQSYALYGKDTLDKASKSQEATRGEDSFGSTTMHTTCTGAKISTPQKDGHDRPYLDCNEISAIHTTLKETGNQTLQPTRQAATSLKNPTIMKPLLSSNAFSRALKGNLFDTKIKENVPFTQPVRLKNKNLWDTNSECDLEVLYSQYLMSHYAALHAEKSLEIQDKDHCRILYSLAEANRSLADQCLKLENQVAELQINNELVEATATQPQSLEGVEGHLSLCIEFMAEIRDFFENCNNQMFLKNVEVNEDTPELEKKLDVINSQLDKFLEVSRNIQPLIDKLRGVTDDILKGKTGQVGNERKIGRKCQELIYMASYQISLFIQAEDEARKKSSVKLEVDDLIWNW